MSCLALRNIRRMTLSPLTLRHVRRSPLPFALRHERATLAAVALRRERRTLLAALPRGHERAPLAALPLRHNRAPWLVVSLGNERAALLASVLWDERRSPLTLLRWAAHRWPRRAGGARTRSGRRAVCLMGLGASRRGAERTIIAIFARSHRHTGGDPLEEVHLLPGEEPPPARLQPFESNRPNRDSRERHDLVTKLCEHPANFAVLALGQDHLQDRGVPLVRDRLDTLRPNLAFGEPDSLDELLKHFGGRLPCDHGAVDLLHAELRVRQLVGQFPVVREEHQPDAHLVEPSDAVDPLRDARNKIHHSGTARGIIVRRYIAFWLVDRDIRGFLILNRHTVDRHAVASYHDLRAEFTGDLAVDCHPSLENHVLRRPAGANPCMRKHLLETLGLHAR